MRHRKATAFALLCTAAILAAGVGAEAADPSGTVVAVVQATRAIGAAGSRMLVTRGPVYMGDTIRTGARGEAQIELADDTRLVVGPNSSMVVDSFVFDSKGKAKDVALNAVRGTFRFITGSSRKSAYKIITPTATIGVRGTEFDFSVDRQGQLNFALFEGQARVCTRSGRRCTVLSGACSVAVFPRSGAVKRLPAGEERTKLLRAKFPYIDLQRRLNRAFRVNTSSCSVRRANLLRGGGPRFTERVAPDIVAPPGTVEPPPVTGTINNHNGFADGTNPGRGSANNNASGGGSQNPGGTGGTGGGGNGGGKGNGGGNGHSG